MNGFWHDLVLSTKIIARRRVRWILMKMLVMAHEIMLVKEILERSDRAINVEMVDINAP